jgi:hypothetical protein
MEGWRFRRAPHSFAGLNEWVGPLRPEVASIPPIKVFRQTSLTNECGSLAE